MLCLLYKRRPSEKIQAFLLWYHVHPNKSFDPPKIANAVRPSSFRAQQQEQALSGLMSKIEQDMLGSKIG
jgi:hypothetical protein